MSKSTLSSLFPPRPKWGVSQMPDLSGKVMIVTGGNAGIGYETVKVLLMHNAKVYMASRTPEKARAAIKDLRKETGKEALFLRLDLADLRSIKAAAEEFLSKETQLHVLFNNAGTVYPDVKEVTADGYDLQFGANVLGHFYLTKLLLRVLLDTAKISPDGKARVIHTSSVGHVFTSGIDFDTLHDGPHRLAQNTVHLYFQSKFGNVVVSDEFHRHYAEQGLVSVSLHPGNLKMDTQRHTSLGAKLIGIMNPILPSAAMGALTQLWAGTMPEGAELGGKYCIPWARVGIARAETDDPELGRRLWAWLEDQVKDL
ncbi:hypothetical protein AcW1_005064 [Taiwanofungus camphoratus]|nr:hypothetical protein AcW2_005926 [Antrodia cinnamomea]KAI0940305.1 hypothetical protein AcV5_001450 [Antrodia cinnamomea]KAI0941151.1 hypothetical protein AcV7_002793 [Antrodia cinnamomea]KAI0960585.1 hypothetical protein AcW1_005064 [Antrodia cinnamomea]